MNMDFDLENIVRENIKKLTAYSSAREDFTGKAQIFLDANESPFENGINRYPDPFQKALKQKLSNIKGIDPGKIFIGNGSDEVLDIAFRSFCEPGKDNMIICPPTYGMYKVLADINNVETKEVLLNRDFTLNTKGVIRAADANTKMVILCSPNNPTGSSIPLAEIEKLLTGLNSMIVVDEAYIDFSEKESAVKLIGQYPNLIVIQTLSKAYGMAGIRVGIALARREVVEIFNKVKPPYNVNTLSQKKALEMLTQEDLYRKNLEKIADQKAALKKALENIPAVEKIFPSDANFFLVRFKNAQETYRLLVKKGVVVRDRSSQPLCENCLRITVGTEKENQILLNVLKTVAL
jgi:histidinol-phosphate aminotransferase